MRISDWSSDVCSSDHEGAEKVWEVVSGAKHSLAEVAAELNSEDHERKMVAGAVRTDFILSAEIMAIALAEVASEPFLTRAAILALVAVAVTIGVSGAVGLIVTKDDHGLHLPGRSDAGSPSGQTMCRDKAVQSC